MDTRDVLVVDGFATAPLAGTPVGLILDGTDLDVTRTQRQAEELAQQLTAVLDIDTEPPTLRPARPTEADLCPAVMIVAAHVIDQRGEFDGGGGRLVGPSGPRELSVDTGGTVWAGIDSTECRQAEASESELAAALGLDPAALRDVGADLPPTRAPVGDGVLSVPVNFLEHLGRIDPDTEALRVVLEDAGVEVLYAFSFDTLGAERAVHGLALDRDGCRQPPTGTPEVAAAAAIERFGALGQDREAIGFEAGDRYDRPARLTVRLGDSPAVGGPCVTALEGSMAVPPTAPDDDILEA